jgi:hypothetical protein
MASLLVVLRRAEGLRSLDKRSGAILAEWPCVLKNS